MTLRRRLFRPAKKARENAGSESAHFQWAEVQNERIGIDQADDRLNAVKDGRQRDAVAAAGSSSVLEAVPELPAAAAAGADAPAAAWTGPEARLAQENARNAANAISCFFIDLNRRENLCIQARVVDVIQAKQPVQNLAPRTRPDCCIHRGGAV